MNKLIIVATLSLISIQNNAFAREITFVSTDNKPLTSTKSVGGLNYGLSDEEIAKRVEMGLAETIPISALKKWQEKRKLENTALIDTVSNPNTQNMPNSQNINKDNINPYTQHSIMNNTDSLIHNNPLMQEKQYVPVHEIIESHIVSTPTTPTKNQNNGVVEYGTIQPIQAPTENQSNH